MQLRSVQIKYTEHPIPQTVIMVGITPFKKKMFAAQQNVSAKCSSKILQNLQFLMYTEKANFEEFY